MGFEIENGVLKKYTEEKGVREVVIPDSVTSIGESAFYKCSSLTSVTIPDSVTSIGDSAFSLCSSLTTVTIPDSVTSIGDSAFRGCTGLADDKGLVIIRNVLYSYHGNDSVVTIPDSVTSIGDYAFYDCKRLTSVTIPDSVTSIGDSAFSECEKLHQLAIFGYVIDAAQWNWEKVRPSDVQSMLNDKNYAVKMDHPTKFQFVAQVFLKDRQPEAEAYIKKNISKILPYFIDIDDYATVKGLLESGKFVTKRNIMKFIDHAIEHTQNGGDMQIQVLLMNYKNDNFPDMDPLKSIKF